MTKIMNDKNQITFVLMELIQYQSQVEIKYLNYYLHPSSYLFSIDPHLFQKRMLILIIVLFFDQMSSHKHLIPAIRSLLAASIFFTLSTQLAEHLSEGEDYHAVSFIFLICGAGLVLLAIAALVQVFCRGVFSYNFILLMAAVTVSISSSGALIRLFVYSTPAIKLLTFILKLSAIFIQFCALAAEFQTSGQINMVEKIKEQLKKNKSSLSIIDGKIHSGEITSCLSGLTVDDLYSLI